MESTRIYAIWIADLTASSVCSQTDVYYRVVWQTTSEGDPGSVAPAACCASHTSCRQRRRPSADGGRRDAMLHELRATHDAR